jgi:hypothetical protein
MSAPSRSPASAAAAQAGPTPAAPKEMSTQGILVRVGLLGGGVVLASGLYLWWDALAKRGQLEAACSGDGSTYQCPQSTSGVIGGFNTEAPVGIVLLGVGLLTMFTAGLLADMAPGPDGTAASIHVGPGGLRGTF